MSALHHVKNGCQLLQGQQGFIQPDPRTQPLTYLQACMLVQVSLQVFTAYLWTRDMFCSAKDVFPVFLS